MIISHKWNVRYTVDKAVVTIEILPAVLQAAVLLKPKLKSQEEKTKGQRSSWDSAIYLLSEWMLLAGDGIKEQPAGLCWTFVCFPYSLSSASSVWCPYPCLG